MPLHLAFRSEPSPERLQAALASVRVASVQLYHSLLGTQPEPSASMVTSALAGSASVLTAQDGLPLHDGQELGLAAFTQLRALTLRETSAPPEVLRATDLPTSLEELTLAGSGGTYTPEALGLPWFAGLERLPRLRRLTLLRYVSWQTGDWDADAQQPGPLHLPPGLEVRAVLLVPELRD